MTPLIFLDTETTGLRPDIHTIWEIAWVTAYHDFEGGALHIVDSFESTVHVGFRELKNADPDALKVGRFEERHRGGKMEKEAVVAELTASIARLIEGGLPLPHFVGAVPGFDHAMLCRNWLGWPGFGEGLWHYHLIDVETLVAGKLGVHPPYKHSELAKAVGVEINKKTRHTAMGDVQTCIGMYAAAYNLEVLQ